MNTQHYRNTLLDSDWVATVTQQITANPFGIAFSIEPAILGQYDSEQGKPCRPNQYFKASDQDAYTAAYTEATQAWAATVQQINDTLPVVDFAGELADLQSGMEDVEFWRNAL